MPDKVMIDIFHAYWYPDPSPDSSSSVEAPGAEIDSHMMPRDVFENSSIKDVDGHLAREVGSLTLEEPTCHVESLTTSSTSTGRIENSDDLNDLHPPCDGVYEALSYTWGSSENPQEISVLRRGRVQILEYEMANSDQKENVLLVSQNLLISLQHLRQPLEDRILWIDAICINQQDVIERGI
ncbi:hypothetical protein IFR04_008517 [Cadophora malorum]|uniref:Heterokaryon incompatibility domain-containing protein n=1 Tax=Cadophora malorum TaxID=108018 RepID=A0A8H7W5Y8_9HELO|nr:hypothetical protein IFR04_008517 [Cadophora malorum]